ncbi:magnesium chelatase [uncultured Mesonia sp.]|uniref:magnesium chelatase n=1 Tax=uncultured Mesonia sp. TaxID=399731 RepID=UPI00374F1E44
MNPHSIKTLGDLKAANYKSKSIKTELRDNLIRKIKAGEQVFTGIFGYEHTVIPELERAILSKHNINLLGLRGQAKTRLARMMVKLLDEYIPVIEGSEINDDPLNPISRYGKEKIAEHGDQTPISWLHRENRFAEKLATPDVSVADLIGDIDPIKAANLKLSYADDRVIHFGMIPRAHRCIFVINELPDLQARIQVALFNILQEGDIQIRGFKLRLPLDLQFIFTANPEDYTNRGSIVTPLKDRIGSQILTHYPQNITIAKQITKQESGIEEGLDAAIYIPELARDLIEQIGFEARKSEYVDAKSGVSARMSITAFQNLISTAERRMLLNDENKTSLRFADFMGIIPALTGKVELQYEGEQEGPNFVAKHLIENAVKSIYPKLLPEIKKLKKQEEASPYDEVIAWFATNDGIHLDEDFGEQEYLQTLTQIKPLVNLVQKCLPELKEKDLAFTLELALWGLTAFNMLSKHQYNNGTQFQDLYSSYLSGL